MTVKNRTTLTISAELADKIRQFKGHNTDQKLKNWAEQYGINKDEYMTRLEIKSLIEQEVVKDALAGRR